MHGNRRTDIIQKWFLSGSQNLGQFRLEQKNTRDLLLGRKQFCWKWVIKCDPRSKLVWDAIGIANRIESSHELSKASILDWSLLAATIGVGGSHSTISEEFKQVSGDNAPRVFVCKLNVGLLILVLPTRKYKTTFCLWCCCNTWSGPSESFFFLAT